MELFTSKYCPSCPAAESYLKERATEDPNLLIVMENVDYWDAPNRIDPHGNPDFTQRQYDYSNLLSDRPGKVFTPQPIINGVTVAEPPMFLGWGSALREGQAQTPATITLTTTKNGILISLPAGLKANAQHELYLLGLEREEGSPLWRAKGVVQAGQNGGDTLTIPTSQLPKGTHVLALLQLTGPGKVVAAGLLAR
ncbi:MAG: DUF1223 domain-containing protein [Alphaproteobacteria bacterium]